MQVKMSAKHQKTQKQREGERVAQNDRVLGAEFF